MLFRSILLTLILLIPCFSYAEEKLKEEASSKAVEASLLPSEDIMIYREGEISDTRRVVGGLTGTLVGFGIGHAIVGKYGEMGWVFTVGEAAAVGAMMAGSMELTTSVMTGEKSHSGLLWLGLAGFYGLRIWEVVDVWLRPSKHNARYRSVKEKIDAERREIQTSFFIAPTVTRDGKPSLGFGISF